MEKMELDRNARLMKMIHDNFDDEQVKDVALYIISSLAVGEAANRGIAMGATEVKGLPPAALDTMYRFDSGLTNNEFFLKHFTTIRAFTMVDKVKMTATNSLLRIGEEKKDKRCLTCARELMLEKMDSLIILALLWKGYEFAVDFTAQLKLVFELDPQVEEYFSSRIS